MLALGRMEDLIPPWVDTTPDRCKLLVKDLPQENAVSESTCRAPQIIFRDFGSWFTDLPIELQIHAEREPWFQRRSRS